MTDGTTTPSRGVDREERSAYLSPVADTLVLFAATVLFALVSVTIMVP